MTVTLPVELQQYILELAVPPLVQPSLDERVRLCKTFSLVHRAWTPIAQRELRAVCRVSSEATAQGATAARQTILAATEAGWDGRRLEVQVHGNCRLDWLGLGVQEVQELWLTCGGYSDIAAPRRVSQKVKKLHVTLCEPATFAMDRFLKECSELTYLHLRPPTMMFRCLSTYPFASTLDTLLIDGVDVFDSISTLLRDWSSTPLRVLFFAAPNRVFSRQELASLPSTLEHFAYLPGHPADEDPSAKYDFATPPFLRLPDSLRSMTFIKPKQPSFEHHIARVVLKVAAKNAGARFTVVREKKEGKRFCAEEWALSVGA